MCIQLRVLTSPYSHSSTKADVKPTIYYPRHKSVLCTRFCGER
ncbi:hypothetical protein HMPREF1861_01841 [Corynebacterium kroppenstedtii]|nr:hypothetical protein HMPREF1861_01841 [Corynebacterium kroppenstedtii]